MPSGSLSSEGDSERGFGEMSRLCVGVCDTARFAGGVVALDESLRGESLTGDEEGDEEEDEEDVVRRESGSGSDSSSGSSSSSGSTTGLLFFVFFFFGFGSRFSTRVAGGGVKEVLVPGAVGMTGEDKRGLEKAWMESTEFIREGEVE